MASFRTGRRAGPSMPSPLDYRESFKREAVCLTERKREEGVGEGQVGRGLH